MIPRWDIRPPNQRNPVSGKLLVRANIPRRFWESTLGLIDESPFKQGYVAYLDQLDDMLKRGRGLFLHGPYGSGKTAAACLVLIDVLCRSANRVYFIPMSDLEWHWRNRHETDENGVPHWDVIVGAPFLVIDDLGAEAGGVVGSEEVASRGRDSRPAFEAVVRARYNGLLPTILTSNVSEDDTFTRFPWLKGLVADSFVTLAVTGNYR